MITFVYRSHYKGPLSKIVRRLPATSIVAWFAQHMARAVDDPDGESKTLGDELGAYVYGLGTIFAAAKEVGFDPPSNMDELRTLLHEHLYVEGGPENIQVDEHSVRVLTDDDEVALAYFFFDDAALAAHPHDLAYLLHDEPRLPANAASEGDFSAPKGLRKLTPRGAGAGATYACLLTFYDGQSIPGDLGVFEGVRLPELVAHMRAVVPDSKPESWSAEYLATWPLELRLLRAALEPGDTTFAPAFARLQQLPLRYIGARTNHSRAGVGAQVDAMREFIALGGERGDGDGDPARSIVDEHPHALLFAIHASSFFGYQQWVLFDDLWATANPDLASSLMGYASSWDPL